MNFNAAISKLLQLLLHMIIPLTAPPVDPEAVVPLEAPENHNLDWGKILVVFSLASAIDIALLSVQIHFQELPLVFHFLALAILLVFSCFFTSKFIHSNSPVIAQVLERFGILFGVTAFFIAITIPFQALWFKCVTCFVYAVSWLAILLCNYTSAK